MMDDAKIAEMDRKVEALREMVQDLIDSAGDVEAVKRNARRILASVKMLELNICDIAPHGSEREEHEHRLQRCTRERTGENCRIGPDHEDKRKGRRAHRGGEQKIHLSRWLRKDFPVGGRYGRIHQP